MKLLRFLFIVFLAILSFYLSELYIRKQEKDDFQKKRNELIQQERREAEVLKRTFNKFNIFRENLNLTLDEIEKNPFDREHIKEKIGEFSRNFQGEHAAEEKIALHLWYLDFEGKLLQLGKGRIKDRKLVSTILNWVISPKGKRKRHSYFRDRGRYRYFFGEDFSYYKLVRYPDRDFSFNFKGRGTHDLCWSRIIDRKKLPNIIRSHSDIKKEAICGVLLCVIDWRNLDPGKVARVVVKNKNIRDLRRNFFFFSVTEGIRKSIYPSIPARYIDFLEDKKDNLGSIVRTFTLGDTLLTAIAIRSRAKSWNYKEGTGDFIGAVIKNKVGMEYLLLKTSMIDVRFEVHNRWYKNR
ncbi:hypothetical protein ACFL35_18665, partial [Candidatus Riflebacteria bacterium]